jgi:hypothetical protein
MTARTFAALCGVLYIGLGVAGFVPALWERPSGGPGLTVKVFYASLFGVFMVNILLSMMHLTIGLWAAMSANNKYSSLIFARGGTIVFLLMGIAGLIPVEEVQTLYGTVPLFGNNVWLHLGTALVGAFFAFRPGYEITQIGLKEEMNPHMPHRP